MWISKKNLEKIKQETDRLAYIRGIDNDLEWKQDERINRLEKQVKKLKKVIKEGK